MTKNIIQITSKYLRIPILFATIVLLTLALYFFWSPGIDPTKVGLNRHTNGIWISHGWIGDDTWFVSNQRDPDKYHSQNAFAKLKTIIDDLHIVYLYPHLCPTNPDGTLPGINPQQVTRLASLGKVKILPWVGGVNGIHVHLGDHAWRKSFSSSILELLSNNPKLHGIHLNIEPLKSGTKEYISLLRDVRASLSSDQILSVAAYPPPTFWQQVDEVHWSKQFYNAVSEYADQLVVMMYDTAIDYKKIYINTYKSWVSEVLAWSNSKDVLFGIPAYEDTGVEYHNPSVENVFTAMSGLSAGIRISKSRSNYRGISVYADWTLEEHEKNYLVEALGIRKSN
jgi:hypothetical protein